MTDKRSYNKSEAIQYFGIDINAFETYIEPELAGKGIAIGTCLVYEARDLDTAWEAFKKKAKRDASVPTIPPQRESQASIQKTRAPLKGAMPSSASSSAAWNAAVTKVLAKDKPKKK
jgi:hypothetical protein